MDEGAAQISTRKIARLASINISLIPHHFDNLNGLLNVVVDTNLERIEHSQHRYREQYLADPRVEMFVAAVIKPLWARASFYAHGRAAWVVQELFPRLAITHRSAVSGRVRARFETLIAEAREILPPRSREANFRKICIAVGAAMSMLPRAPAWELYHASCGDMAVDDDEIVTALIETFSKSLA